jgi:transposase
VQKALLQMNVQLSQAVTDVTGMTGQRIIRAIVAGLRDAEQLASLREPGCKHSEEEIAKALTGTWRAEHLYVLKQSLELYDFYTEKIEACDAEISRQYGMTRPDWKGGELPVMPEKKRHAHSKNAPKEAKEIREHLYRINGVGLEPGGWHGGLAGANGDDGGGEPCRGEVPDREAFQRLAGAGAQTRYFRGQGIE